MHELIFIRSECMFIDVAITSLQDDKGCTPLLRICMHTQSKKETVQMLRVLDAEIDSSTSIVNASNRNP